jgi:ABC-type phosphate/phosphonate transport system substrate-binding protein
MIAALPMYDWPELREATDAFWQGLAHHLGVAIKLTRRPDYAETWRASDLLFGQTCGYPFTHEFRGRLTYVATPRYRADGCQDALYSSIVFARGNLRPEQLRNAVVAINNRDSMSGMLAVKLVFAPFARAGHFFSRCLETGGHLNSLRAVREGLADVCAIDAVCVAQARRCRPGDLEGLHEIARSPLVPALPFVTTCGAPAELRAALGRAFADPCTAAAREALLLDGCDVLPAGAYDRILDLERQVEDAGGLALF